MQASRRIRALAAGLAVGVAAQTAWAVPAAAHVTVEPEEAAAGGYAYVELAVPHGCDGSATTELRVQIPENVPTVTPERVPDWDLSVKEGSKEATEVHGETVTEGISEIRWKAQDPLPDGELTRFGISMLLPDEEGAKIELPAIQKCEKGETRWIQPTEGDEEPEEPAPFVTLTAGDDAHASSGGDAEAEASPADGDDDGDGNGLAIAGLALGAIGAITGGVALGTSRRR